MVSSAVFADSVYFLALTVERDALHSQVVAIEAAIEVAFSQRSGC